MVDLTCIRSIRLERLRILVLFYLHFFQVFSVLKPDVTDLLSWVSFEENWFHQGLKITAHIERRKFRWWNGSLFLFQRGGVLHIQMVHVVVLNNDVRFLRGKCCVGVLKWRFSIGKVVGWQSSLEHPHNIFL